jgi:hypothetical protein
VIVAALLALSVAAALDGAGVVAAILALTCLALATRTISEASSALALAIRALREDEP